MVRRGRHRLPGRLAPDRPDQRPRGTTAGSSEVTLVHVALACLVIPPRCVMRRWQTAESRPIDAVHMSIWIAVLVVFWLFCWLACWRMGRETGYPGLLFGVLGPLGVAMLALLPSRKEPSPEVRRLEEKGVSGLRVRRRNLNVLDPGIGTLEGEGFREIEKDVTGNTHEPDDASPAS
jgi:hypothetical protein